MVVKPGGEKADRGSIEILFDECKGCGLCISACPVECIGVTELLNLQGYFPAYYLGRGCTGCGICFYVCPEPGAIRVFVRGEPRS